MLGLPSRSPPIHDPKWMGVASCGSDRPVASTRARSTARRYSGNASHKLCSKITIPARTSSSGDTRERRTSSVCHADAIDPSCVMITSAISSTITLAPRATHTRLRGLGVRRSQLSHRKRR